MINYLKSNKVYLVYIPLTIYWTILFIATSIPADYSLSIGFGDKFSHFFAYLVLSILLFFTLSFQEKFVEIKKYPGIISILIASFYGIFDELHQIYIPGRSAELLDWVADLIGAIIGIIVIKIFFMKYQGETEVK